jgi:lipoic acid synthetase
LLADFEPALKSKRRKPPWLKVRPPGAGRYARIKEALRRLGLHTVCEGARCPNLHECWGSGTATLMLLGEVCTRGCRFCAVAKGRPEPPDPDEPKKVAQAVAEWGLEYVVLTSVSRDDLPDGGADHFAKTVEAIKRGGSASLVEVLIPDFRGDLRALERLVEAGPDVVGHNIETVERLTPLVRDRRAGYRQSLKVLEQAKRLAPSVYTKSALMLGLGETEEEVLATMRDLRAVGVDFLALGQYLQPTERHLPVREYIPPERFQHYARLGEELGFLAVAAGPLVRSSYRAGELFMRAAK